MGLVALRQHQIQVWRELTRPFATQDDAELTASGIAAPGFSPLRTTETAMGFVRNLITTNPVTSMTVINNNVNATQFGTQQ